MLKAARSLQTGSLSFNGPERAPGATTERDLILPFADEYRRYRNRVATRRAAAGERYSITSSAPLINDCESSSPSVLAAFRLTKSSTFVTSWTGSSEGFAPSRIRPA